MSLKTCFGGGYECKRINENRSFVNRKKNLQYACEKKGSKQSDDAADDDLAHTMPDALLEARKFAFVEVESFDEHVEVAALVAEVHADAGGVVHEDEGERCGYGEGAGADPFVPTDADGKRDGERGVGRGHVPVREHIFRLPSMFEREDGELDRLGPEADDEREHDDEIGMSDIHSGFDRS